MVGRESGRSGRDRRGGRATDRGDAGGTPRIRGGDHASDRGADRASPRPAAAAPAARHADRASPRPAAKPPSRTDRDGEDAKSRGANGAQDAQVTRDDGRAVGADQGTGHRARPSASQRRGAARAHRLLGLSSTRRAAVLALVVCAVALSVAVPLRNYFAQRSALEETLHQQERLREQVDGLEQRKAQLSDPAQVEVEARDRLRYVRPGETPYVVQLPSATPATQPPVEPRAAAGSGSQEPIADGSRP